MIRNIYHGSDRIVRRPQFSDSRAFNDYGLGFYCTESEELAKEWAVRTRRNGFVSVYRMEMDGLMVIDLGSPQYTVLHWLGVLLSSREMGITSSAVYQAAEYIIKMFAVEYQSCDCIIGYRGDNSNYSLARAFMGGRLSYGDLRDVLRHSGAHSQLVLKSNRAFDRLTFAGYTPVLYSECYPAGVRRDLELRRSIEQRRGPRPGQSSEPRRDPRQATAVHRKEKTARSDAYGLYITDILERSIMPSDPLLR